jgi:hypothetical protein
VDIQVEEQHTDDQRRPLGIWQRVAAAPQVANERWLSLLAWCRCCCYGKYIPSREIWGLCHHWQRCWHRNFANDGRRGKRLGSRPSFAVRRSVSDGERPLSSLTYCVDHLHGICLRARWTKQDCDLGSLIIFSQNEGNFSQTCRGHAKILGWRACQNSKR